MEIIQSLEALHNIDPTGLRHFVPTMGALHPGHLSLIEAAVSKKSEGDQVWVSIFVNPIQFNQSGDFENYPNTLEADLKACESAGADVVFLPTPQMMYPEGFSMKVSESSLGDYLCGATRPGHFDGVCTVITKFFNMVKPKFAYFGEKDFQQLAIIRKMVVDLNFDVSVVGVPTMREPSGLAMSSRNLRLAEEHQPIAPLVYETLCEIKSAIQQGGSWVDERGRAKEKLEQAGFEIDYLELVTTDTLQPVKEASSSSICAIAAFLGEVRLIDHVTIQK